MYLDGWEQYAISDLVHIIGGGTPKTSIGEYWNGDIPWLSVKDFNNNYRKVYSTEKKITQQGLKNSTTKLLGEGDLIISARGTVGALAQLGRPMAFNQSCYGLKAKDNKTTNDFLYYLLKLKINEIKANTHGSVFDTITTNTFDILSVVIPKDLKEQKAISATLSALDDKIELNNRINKTLEEMAQAIFKQWFVDFDFPDESGQPYKSSGGEMEESELGLIPKGWKVGLLSDIAFITMGQSPSGSSYNESGDGSVFYQGRAEFGTRFPTRRLFTTEPKRMAIKGDVLMSVRAPVGDINVAIESCCIGRGLAAIQSKYGYSSFLLYTLLSLKKQLDVFNGEGTVFGSINKQSLNELRVIIPIDDVIKSFEDIVKPMDIMFENNYKVLSNLQSIRDSLLPKLMSGEIRVPVEEVPQSV